VIAVLPVRHGQLPSGADVTVDEVRGRVLVIGEGTRDAAAALKADVAELAVCEAGSFAPGAWATGLAALLGDERAVVLPGSPDGRDLAGRLAAAMGRPCHAWCSEVRDDEVVVTRREGAESVTLPAHVAFVATLVPRVHAGSAPRETPPARSLELAPATVRDAAVVAESEADPAEVDLAEAPRIVAGGMGLGGAEGFELLGRVAAALRASLGATRPVADLGIVAHERQIGTTGVAVDPVLYLAFGISGAIQHTAGLGQPDRIVAVNTDPSCPMMAMADLAVVADAVEVARALERRLTGTAQ